MRLPKKRDIEAYLASINYSFYIEKATLGKWKPAPHLTFLCRYMEMIERGEVKNLIITMPPRHGKSMAVTESFPSWFIGKNPERKVIEVSYGDNLARKFGRANKQKLEDFGLEFFNIRVSRENASGTDWSIEGHAGGMISAGIGGSITGQGADLLIIDDPIKNRKEAESITYRENLWNEWQNTLNTRLSPSGSVIIIMTRWHEDDLVGRLLSQDKNKWIVLNLPILAEKEDILGRKEGAPLWPEYGFDSKWIEETRKSVGSVTFASLYQGHPMAASGNLFKLSMFRKFSVMDGLFYVDGKIYEISRCKIFQSCDVAGSTKTSADYFVLGTFAITPSGELLVLEILRERLEGPEQPDLIMRKYKEYRPFLIGVESANMGLTLYQQLRKDGLPVIELKPETDKYTRAIPAAARYEAGMIYHRDKAAWLDDLENELIAFPKGSHDDQVDVISYAVFMQSWGYLKEKRKISGRALVLG